MKKLPNPSIAVKDLNTKTGDGVNVRESLMIFFPS